MCVRLCCRKARRKEREGEPAGDPKLYLQEALLERKLPELDMRQLVDLPLGLDYNEWLASHSQYSLQPPPHGFIVRFCHLWENSSSGVSLLDYGPKFHNNQSNQMVYVS